MEKKNWRLGNRWIEEKEIIEKYYSGKSSPPQFNCGLKKEDRWGCITGQLFIPEELMKFRKIFEKAHDAIIILDKGRIIDANQGALDLFGFESKRDITGHTPADLSPEIQPVGEYSGNYADKWLKAANKGLFQHFSWQHQKTDGSLIDTEVSLNHINWNSRVLLIGFIRNRTESVKIERQIQERLGYYNMIIGALPVMLYTADVDLPFGRTWASDKIMTMSGFERSRFGDRSFWYSRIHPVDRDNVKHIFEECSAENIIMIDYRWQKADGEYVWFRDWAVIHHDKNGQGKEILGILQDVDYQRKSQENIEKNEAFLQYIIDNLPAMVFLKKADDFSFVRINKSGEELIGKSYAEIVGRNDTDLFPGIQAERYVNTDREAIRKNKVVDIEAEKIMTPTGERVLHTRKIPLLDNAGRPEYLLGVSIDITERQKMTNALMESEEKYRALFESLPVGIAITTLDGGILAANQTVCRMFGYDRNELQGQDMQIIYAEPDARVKMLSILEREGKVSNFETIFMRKEGSAIPVSLNVIPYALYDEGALLTVINDISNQRKSEEKIRQLSRSVEQSPAAVIIMGLQGTIEYVNPRFTEITGYTSSETMGNDLNMLYPGGSAIKQFTGLLECLEQQTFWKGTLSSKHKNGETFYGEISLSPLKDNLGNVTHHIAVMEDITPRIRSEQDLRKAKEKAEESDRLKTAFLSNISHEVRTPMNAVVGFSQLLKDTSLSPEKRDSFINMIASKSDDLLRILDEIIDISMIQSGQVMIRYEEFWLDELFDELFDRFACRVKPGVELVKSLSAASINHVLSSDKRRVKQIMESLIDNAIKYTDSGMITFGFKSNPDGRSVVLFVKDTGIGIDPSRLDVIFKPFMQEDVKDRQARGGKGVGLTISQKLTEILGGEIRVRSRKGAGTEFFVELPFMPKLHDEVVLDYDQNKKRNDTSGHDWTGRTILIAEDDLSNFRYLELLLQKTGAKIMHCDDGQEVVEKIRGGSRPDVILMDIRMPVMNGVESTKVLRSEKYGGTIVALTAYNSPEEKRT
ncbi:MAG TPA: PAS domain S-box protein, partial [Bacteroidales bacterium]|nr:PAS domain S-box protein [Bacteroidales bacterium]